MINCERAKGRSQIFLKLVTAAVVADRYSRDLRPLGADLQTVGSTCLVGDTGLSSRRNWRSTLFDLHALLHFCQRAVMFLRSPGSVFAQREAMYPRASSKNSAVRFAYPRFLAQSRDTFRALGCDCGRFMVRHIDRGGRAERRSASVHASRTPRYPAYSRSASKMAAKRRKRSP
jgi:hypothetical protein